MSYTLFENSRSKAKPILLFYFITGAGPDDYYCFTTHTENVEFLTPDGVRIFAPSPLKLDIPKKTGKLKSSETTVEGATTPVVEEFEDWPTSFVIRLQVWRGHLGDNGFRSVFKGRVTGLSAEGALSKLGVEPISTSLRRLGLTRNWQYACPHPLYSQGDFACNADKAASTVIVAPISVNTPNATFPNGWNADKPADKFVGGLAEWESPDGRTQKRNIVDVSGNVLRFSGKAVGLITGTPVKLSLGCAHDMTDCRDLFNNMNNYGGDPWIPLDNPFGIKNIFSGG